ncbi:MAG: hypothetical protein LBL31_00550 [Spirochaetaceae bacterium]|jgi:hypothetical protein|nr:hypothetical protein [Spirochaetaceae bacterium]
MKKGLRRGADIFFTLFLTASLSGCASVIEYWSTDGFAVPADAQAAGEAVESSAPSPEQAVFQEETGAPAENPSTAAAPVTLTDTQKKAAEDELAAQPAPRPAVSGAVPAAVSTALADAEKKAANAEDARKKAEDELAAANKRIAELEAARPAPGTVSAGTVPAPADRSAELAAAQKQAAEAEAARKKADTDAAAAKKRAADAEAARKKADADAAAAKKKADADLAATQKRAADAETARQKAEADAEAARKRAEEISLLLQPVPDTGNKRAGETGQTPQISRAGQQTPAMANASLTVSAPAVAGTVAETEAAAAPPPVRPAQDAVLPKYYTVGTWPPDCFWAIAELVYGDPYRWPILYEANRSKLEDPDNPDLLATGIILEIPSINGEFRDGSFNR